MAGSSLRVRRALDGRYLVGAKIGGGTHGVIHRATDLETGEVVAISS